MSKIKINLNEIGTATIKILDSKIKDLPKININGPFQSPLSTAKTIYTNLYIPRFKSLLKDGELLESLKQYIGINIYNNDKKKWIENAQYLFINKVHIENYLKAHMKDVIADPTNPTIIIENAQKIIKEFFFYDKYEFKYENKKLRIDNSPKIECTFKGMHTNETILKNYKEKELQQVRKAYIKELTTKLKDVTNDSAKKLIKVSLEKEYTTKYGKVQKDIDKYKIKKDELDRIEKKIDKLPADGNTDVELTNLKGDVKKLITEPEYANLKEKIDKFKANFKLQLPLYCKIENLELEDITLQKKWWDINACRKSDNNKSVKLMNLEKACKALKDKDDYTFLYNTCTQLLECASSSTAVSSASGGSRKKQTRHRKKQTRHRKKQTRHRKKQTRHRTKKTYCR
jgi:hypothetical protein